jgi:hypothetical protein
VPWLHIGTTIGAIAAIGGLLFTGITAMYGAAVARDQLAQSREDSERSKREQASRVSYWVENDETRLHVMNRSLDPIQNVIVYFMAGLWDYGVTPVAYAVALRSIPPCSEVLFERQNLRWRQPKKTERLEARGPLVDRPEEISEYHKLTKPRTLRLTNLLFADRDGFRWARSESGRLQTQEPLYDWDVTTQDPLPKILVGESAGEGAIREYPLVKSLESCNDG